MSILFSTHFWAQVRLILKNGYFIEHFLADYISTLGKVSINTLPGHFTMVSNTRQHVRPKELRVK